ncbi:mechanosensitive ion channel protein MscS [Agromyces rhizosphaerae]|uniref:Mechanosensitive ion channel protein MscS n=1 Tax=Agromyces rhizosphaerae TaxID=88374 RepID=A0A9W6FP88_9MICO|nr:mechanosensitive ion channel domain-containing protein [Agromyces rhizosphaerae]GLI27286.1 mechanosensitive ion channel protein MscS [Agromyces rhizosphaerae]
MLDWEPWLGFGLSIVVALIIALAAIVVVAVVARGIAARNPAAGALIRGIRHPFRVLVVIVALWIATVVVRIPEVDWRQGLWHLMLIATIAAGAWFVNALLSFAFERVIGRYDIDVADNRLARRVRTQLTIVRRLLYVLVWVIAVASILLTFDGVRAVGASLLASAGLASIVAGLAAQSTLANIFAGVQLAFTDAIRVDDVVIVEGEWGKIEEITLTYVVVHIWDDRRLVLPSTYFTTTPFENWTRRSSELLGAIEFDLDWRVSPGEMRRHLDDVLGRTELWDGRASVLQVTDAVNGYVRIRILVTAVDAPTLYDLRCFVREEMVEWFLARDVAALPVTRVQMVEEPMRADREHRANETGHLFSGSPEAEERAHQMTGAVTLPSAEQSGHGTDAPEGAVYVDGERVER